MARDYTITAARNAGEKPNTHPKAKPGSVLVKWYLKLADSEAGDDDVYCQKQPGNDLSKGMEITGRLEKGEYGWRLFPESQQGSGGGNFTAPKYERVPDNSDRSRRIERQHSQSAAVAYAGIMQAEGKLPEDFGPEQLRTLIDWFAKDVDR